MSTEDSKTGFRNAVNAYLENVENGHHHPNDDADCDAVEGFYIIGYMDGNGVLATYACGHKMEPSTVVGAMVSVVDEFMMKEMTDLPPLLRFARSRDLIHNGADAVAPPGEAAQALQDFTIEMNRDDDDV